MSEPVLVVAASQGNRKILIVNADQQVSELLRRYLQGQGFQIWIAADVSSMEQMMMRERFGLVLLDLVLPDDSGLSVCSRLRKESRSLPIIMTSARADAPDRDRIRGLEAGADDFLSYPFNPRELLARMRAVLRRSVLAVPGAPSARDERVSFGPFELNLSTRELRRAGELIGLTTSEFAVLKVLVQHPRQPLSRDKLMQLARGPGWYAMERSIDVQVSRLRRLLEPDAPRARYLQTVWGVGYVFVPDAD